MTKANSSELIFIVDRSGSMEGIRHDMEGGFTAFMEEQRKVPGDCRVTLVQFATDYEIVYAGTPLHGVPLLKIIPGGGTALLDAIGRTIHETGERLSAMHPSMRPARVLVVVITDGEENSSRIYSRSVVFDMIAHQTERYGWAFMFMGANQDAIDEAGKIGIKNALTYDANAVGARASFTSSSKSAARYRSSGQLMSNDEIKTSYVCDTFAINNGLPIPAAPEAVPVPVIVVNVPTIAGAVKPSDKP